MPVLHCDICGLGYTACWRLVEDHYDHVIVASFCPQCGIATERRRIWKK